MQRYQHPRLQGHRWTRLLRLEPAKSLVDPIRCSLHEVSLDTNPGYEAISYSWDGQASNQEVFCSGRQLLVTANAAMVLRHLRQRRQPRWIWIDSICINQNDVEEKTGQVRLMAEIYSKAVEVLLWLGESTKTSGMVLKSISSKARREVQRKERPFNVAEAVLESDLFHDFLAITVVKPILACAGMFSASHKRMITMASGSDPPGEILANTVFERMWCVQEIALARRVRIICGKDTTTLEDLEWYLESLEKATRTMDQSVKFKIHKSRMAIHHDLRTAIQAARFPQAGVHAPWPPASVLLDCARKKGATEAKDKIFALAGIFSFMGVNLFPPDYRRPTWQVYREATVAAIQHDRSLDILYQITGLNKTDFLPSWVPDYSITSSPTAPAYEFSHASRNSQRRWRFDFTTGDLCLLGLIIDSINECSAPLLPEPTNDSPLNETKTNATSASTLHVFKAWASTALQLTTYPTRESPAEAFARTLCTSAILRSNFAIKDFTSGFPKWLELINGPDPAASLENALSDTASRYSYESSHRSHEQRAYARELLATGLGSGIGVMTIGAERKAKCLHYWLYLQCEQKALFVTRNGYLGIGSHSVCGGDLVVLFSGMNVPFVVRRMGTCWRLVAPVYVHGIMQGERWDERREVEEFQLA